ncbi:NYN domain-containing protein [Candidatus Daviesbacteria bacterium]|nr:NYN domain-containing protein [Candidatus Daviesbacteria bacterium]
MQKVKLQISKKKRIAIFIDAANIFYSTQTLGWKLDYQKFMDYWQNMGRLTGAYFYTAVISTKIKQLKFYKALERIGYKVITRELKIIKDNKNKVIIHKGNFDVKLAIDIVLKAKEFDIAILASGDSDFETVIEYLQSINKKVIVISARGHISKELARKASQYLPLEKIKSEVRKD